MEWTTICVRKKNAYQRLQRSILTIGSFVFFCYLLRQAMKTKGIRSLRMKFITVGRELRIGRERGKKDSSCDHDGALIRMCTECCLDR